MTDGFVRAAQIVPLDRQDYERLARAIARHLQPGEDLADALVAGAYLGHQRAYLLQRSPTYADVVFGLSVLTHWPFKPAPRSDVESQLLYIRPGLINRLADVDPAQWESTPLAQAVPASTLMLPEESLYEKQQLGVSSFLNVSTTMQSGM